MAAFTFRFDHLLNLKENMEKNMKNKLGIAIQALEKQKQELAEIRHAIFSQEEAYRQETKETVLYKLKQRLAYMRRLEEMEKEQQERVNEAARNVDKIREQLIHIMKEKKILENLKERERIIFRKNQEKTEQILIDELINYKESLKENEDA